MAVVWAPHASKKCRDEFWQNKVIKANLPEFRHLEMKRGTLSTHLAIPINILSEQVQQVWHQTYVYGKFDWQFLGNTYHSWTTATTLMRTFQHPMPRDKKHSLSISICFCLGRSSWSDSSDNSADMVLVLGDAHVHFVIRVQQSGSTVWSMADSASAYWCNSLDTLHHIAVTRNSWRHTDVFHFLAEVFEILVKKFWCLHSFEMPFNSLTNQYADCLIKLLTTMSGLNSQQKWPVPQRNRNITECIRHTTYAELFNVNICWF